MTTLLVTVLMMGVSLGWAARVLVGFWLENRE